MEDNNLIAAYRNTHYVVPSLKIIIRISEQNKKLDDLLFKNNAITYAFITAYNPMSQKLDNKENLLRHEELFFLVKQMGLFCFEGYGEGSNGWEDEKSLLILDIHKDEAIKLGEFFNQKAIVFGEINKAPELLIIN